MRSMLYIVMLLLCCSFKGLGQDSISLKEKSCQVLLQFHVSYKVFIGDTYIEPTQDYSGVTVRNQFDWFNKKNTPGFAFGGLVAVRLSTKWKLNFGLTYCFRQDRFEINQDTLIEYAHNMSTRTIWNVSEYNYNYNNLELPFLVQFNFKQFSLCAGFKYALFSLRNTTYTYLIKTSENEYIKTDKKFSEWELPLKFYPTIQLNYTFRLKKFTIMPYCSIDFFEINFKEFYMHVYTNPSIWVDSYGPKIENCFFLNAGLLIPLLVNKN